MIQKSIINNGKQKSRLDFHYKYDSSGAQTGITLFENGFLYYKDIIKDVSKTERHIKSYDSAGRLSTYIFKFNNQDLKVYEKTKKWDYVIRGEYFEINEEYEYLYKYDAVGNWTERIKQTYCPVKKKQAIKKPVSKLPVVEPVKTINEDCETTLKEKLIRKIYY